MVKPTTAQVTLPSDSEVLVTRDFSAPRSLVYEAYTNPDLVRRWLLGPDGWSMPVCEMDVRVGGEFRWRWRADEGDQEFGFHGEYLELDAPARIRNTEYFDPGTLGGDMGEGHAVITVELTERDGVTTLSTLMDYGTRESRDAAIATGMTDGMEESYQRLDELVQEVAAG